MKKTILIFGASSFVGSNLLANLKDDFRVIGTYNKTPVKVPGVTCFPCDVLKKDYVNRLVALTRPDFTIYAVGMSSIKNCHKEPKLADALNSTGASYVCKASERVGAKFIYLSSSYVLSGEDVLAKESDMPMPFTAYGNTVSSGEFYVQRSSINYLVLRSCPLYGRSYSHHHPNIFEYVQDRLSRGESFSLDSSVKTGFLDVVLFAKVLKNCLDKNITNRLLQVSSKDIISDFEFAQLYARTFRKPDSMIQVQDEPLPVENPHRGVVKNPQFRMDLTNIEMSLGIELPTVADSLLFTKKRLDGKLAG